MPVSHDALPPYLSERALNDLIRRALDEDVGTGDVTTLATIAPETRAEGRFVAKGEGIVAGLHVAARVFGAVDAAVEVDWRMDEGTPVEPGTVVGTVRGPARSILTAERLALNVLQRMGGIATATSRMVAAAKPHEARILDTRKTAPGLRGLDKWAVRLGGGHNHRIGLFDMILIKDNHIAAAGSVSEAIRAARHYIGETEKNLDVEIEARTLDEVRAVLDAGGVDVILLDNMVRVTDAGEVDTSMLRDAVGLVAGSVRTEASGNVTLDTVPAIAATGVDYISCGALTHSVQALDLSLQVTLR